MARTMQICQNLTNNDENQMITQEHVMEKLDDALDYLVNNANPKSLKNGLAFRQFYQL